jgi:hypothetical protein
MDAKEFHGNRLSGGSRIIAAILRIPGPVRHADNETDAEFLQGCWT